MKNLRWIPLLAISTQLFSSLAMAANLQWTYYPAKIPTAVAGTPYFADLGEYILTDINDRVSFRSVDLPPFLRLSPEGKLTGTPRAVDIVYQSFHVVAQGRFSGSRNTVALNVVAPKIGCTVTANPKRVLAGGVVHITITSFGADRASIDGIEVEANGGVRDLLTGSEGIYISRGLVTAVGARASCETRYTVTR